MSRHELRTRQVEAVLGYLARYASAGHRLRFERRHGAREDDNEIVFSVADWPAFVEVMEPGHPLGQDAGTREAGPHRRD